MTRDKLDKEVAKLRSELSDENGADTAAAEALPDDDAPQREEHWITGEAAVLQSEMEKLLRDHGISTDDLGDLWTQFSSELRDLPEKKPLITVLGAFALGVVVGRISKR